MAVFNLNFVAREIGGQLIYSELQTATKKNFDCIEKF